MNEFGCSWKFADPVVINCFNFSSDVNLSVSCVPSRSVVPRLRLHRHGSCAFSRWQWGYVESAQCSDNAPIRALLRPKICILDGHVSWFWLSKMWSCSVFPRPYRRLAKSSKSEESSKPSVSEKAPNNTVPALAHIHSQKEVSWHGKEKVSQRQLFLTIFFPGFTLIKSTKQSPWLETGAFPWRVAGGGAHFACGFSMDTCFAHAACHYFNSGASLWRLISSRLTPFTLF